MEMAIRRDNLMPGDCISLDQFESSARGRLPHTFGKESSSMRYVAGLLGIDRSSGYGFLRNQVSLQSGNTVRSMREFEKEALQSGVKFKKLHADNFPFDSDEFKAHVQDQPQTSSHDHQNAAIERCIKTISYLCQSMLLHQLLHWPAVFDLAMWPFAMEQAVFLWNHMPNERNRLTPVELFTSTKLHSYDALSRARVWGAPTFVLSP